MNLKQLRTVLREPIVALYKYTEKELPLICATLGFQFLGNGGPTKQTCMRSSFENVSETDLPKIAENFLEVHSPNAALRNEIQDILWQDTGLSDVTKNVRRQIADALSVDDLYLDGEAEEFLNLLQQFWVLDDDPMTLFTGKEPTPLAEVRRHVVRNPGDWTTNDLFKHIGALEAPNPRFIRFIEGLISPEVRPDPDSQKHVSDKLNVVLRPTGIEFRETDIRDGYPVFTACSLRIISSSRPKNLIFASQVKPDLRINDAISNTIEIASNADKVLVYDRPFKPEGLLWQDLQDWWKAKENISDPKDGKQKLYNRLRMALPKSSPPQRNLFEGYHKAFAPSIPKLPALLPEVWLLWDPKTVKERGRNALTRFRMDFLMLFPNDVRVVLEVDGKQHYSINERADPSTYARMVAADRELKLAGYEVYRFGAIELKGANTEKLIKEFFETLFKRHGIAF